MQSARCAAAQHAPCPALGTEDQGKLGRVPQKDIKSKRFAERHDLSLGVAAAAHHTMKKHTTQARSHTHNLAEEAQALLEATTEVAGDKIAEARKRLTTVLAQGKDAWEDLQENAVEKAKAADEAIRENPYRTMGIAFGVGALVGYLFARKH